MLTQCVSHFGAKMYGLSKFISVVLFLSKTVSEYMKEMLTGLCDIEEKVLE